MPINTNKCCACALLPAVLKHNVVVVVMVIVVVVRGCVCVLVGVGGGGTPLCTEHLQFDPLQVADHNV